jgi:hypothetical protein
MFLVAVTQYARGGITVTVAVKIAVRRKRTAA